MVRGKESNLQAAIHGSRLGTSPTSANWRGGLAYVINNRFR